MTNTSLRAEVVNAPCDFHEGHPSRQQQYKCVRIRWEGEDFLTVCWYHGERLQAILPNAMGVIGEPEQWAVGHNPLHTHKHADFVSDGTHHNVGHVPGQFHQHPHEEAHCASSD